MQPSPTADLVLTLRLAADGRAEAVTAEGDTLATFAPADSLARSLLHLDAANREAPAAYGRRRLADFAYPPDPGSALVLAVADPALVAIPWEYLHTGDDFVILDRPLLRAAPMRRGNRLPRPDPALPWRLVALGSDP